jgi:glucose/arabinose dehydrogenase
MAVLHAVLVCLLLGIYGPLCAHAVCPSAASSNPISGAATPPDFCAAYRFATASTPRGIFSVGQDLLVLERGTGIRVMWDANGDGVIGGGETAQLVSYGSLNHAVIAPGDGFMYACSQSACFRWSYPGEGTHSSAAVGSRETIVSGIPTGGHSTRTPALGPDGLLYISVGSNANMDLDASRSAVKRCSATQLNQDWDNDCVYYGDGFRNEVGLRFTSDGTLWGVENGVDRYQRADIGGQVAPRPPPVSKRSFTDTGCFFNFSFFFPRFSEN